MMRAFRQFCQRPDPGSRDVEDRGNPVTVLPLPPRTLKFHTGVMGRQASPPDPPRLDNAIATESNDQIQAQRIVLAHDGVRDDSRDDGCREDQYFLSDYSPDPPDARTWLHVTIVTRRPPVPPASTLFSGSSRRAPTRTLVRYARCYVAGGET